MSRSVAIANDPIAEEAAQDYLSLAGSATGAVLCGFFAAAGAHSGVLFGPLTLVVAGIGSGARAFDGRMRQPGHGSKRPRGTLGSQVPEQARLAVPATVPALFVALAYDGSQKLASILRPGLARALRAGAQAREGLLRQVRASGAGTFSDTAFVRAMLRVAGPSQGGLLTSTDFGSVTDIDHAAVKRTVGGRELYEAPWADEGEAVDVSELGLGQAIVAADVRGQLAALCYRRVVDGFPLEELEIEAPLCAVPVRRGVRRVAPGHRLAAPAPVAVIADEHGGWVEAIAMPTSRRLDPSAAGPRLAVRRSPSSKEIESVKSA